MTEGFVNSGVLAIECDIVEVATGQPAVILRRRGESLSFSFALNPTLIVGRSFDVVGGSIETGASKLC
jgi:hypothetical protein